MKPFGLGGTDLASGSRDWSNVMAILEDAIRQVVAEDLAKKNPRIPLAPMSFLGHNPNLGFYLPASAMCG